MRKVNKKLFELYIQAAEFAIENKQIVGPKNDYYITLAQLESLISLVVTN